MISIRIAAKSRTRGYRKINEMTTKMGLPVTLGDSKIYQGFREIE